MIFDRCLFTGELGYDGSEGVHVGFEDDIVGVAPALPVGHAIMPTSEGRLVHR
jgi:hypothetical protein